MKKNNDPKNGKIKKQQKTLKTKNIKILRKKKKKNILRECSIPPPSTAMVSTMIS